MTLFNSYSFKWLGLLAAAIVLSGCAGMESSNERQSGRIKIISEPAGAVAYADGSELGITPLEIVPGDHFRSGFVGASYRYNGKLSIKKVGCETWLTEVDDAILAKDVHAKLKCDPDFKPSSTSTPSAGSTSMVNSPPKDQIIERLERIESLHKKGLISDEEYKQLRTRIIEKL